MRWWGWGDPAQAAAADRARAGLPARPWGSRRDLRPPVALRAVRLAPITPAEQMLGKLRGVVGSESVRDEHAERVLHAAGKGYPDLLRLRAGAPDGAPDVVVLPGSHDQLRPLLELCAGASLAVVPFGGGTSVVGGVAACGRARRSGGPRHGPQGEVLELGPRVAHRHRPGRPTGSDARAVPGSERAHPGSFPRNRFEYVSLGGVRPRDRRDSPRAVTGAIERMVLGQASSPPGRHRAAGSPGQRGGPRCAPIASGLGGDLRSAESFAASARGA